MNCNELLVRARRDSANADSASMSRRRVRGGKYPSALGMNGRMLATELLRQHPESKVLYMSGYTNEGFEKSSIRPSLRLREARFTF